MAFDDLFLRACRREPVRRVPAWYMRQIGRYQPEYRAVRQRLSLIEICERPDVCAELTALPISQLGVDAAILFSDIMIPIGPLGIDFEIVENRGPVIANPLRTAADVERLRELDPEGDLPHVLDTIRILSRSLEVPIIGFTGAPFTLASYLIEGGPSRDYARTKALMMGERGTWESLMNRLADMIVTYLRAQVAAGASAVQIFDSWAGSLAPSDYLEYVQPTMKRIFAELKPLGVPRIYFGVGTGELLPMWGEVGADVVGLDWRVSIAAGRRRLGSALAVQGNLDPAVLMAPWVEIERRAGAILEQGCAEPGYVFNLGHGVIKDTSPDVLRRLTRFVHERSEQLLRV